jgi:hypothetical protein
MSVAPQRQAAVNGAHVMIDAAPAPQKPTAADIFAKPRDIQTATTIRLHTKVRLVGGYVEEVYPGQRQVMVRRDGDSLWIGYEEEGQVYMRQIPWSDVREVTYPPVKL